MKKLLFAICWAFLPMFASAQYFLSDALILQSSFEAATTSDPQPSLLDRGQMPAEVQDVFKRLLKVNTLTQASFRAFAGNPFITVNAPSNASLAPAQGLVSSAPGMAPGFSVAALADGLASFLVKRTKQELSLAFFKDFKEKVASQPILLRFFPATAQQVQQVDQDIYQFNFYLESLRQTFIADLRILPGRLSIYLREPATDPASAQQRWAASDLFQLAQFTVDSVSPVEMLRYLSSNEAALHQATPAQPVAYNAAMGFRMLNLLSESLRKPADEGWYTASEIKKAFQDPKVRSIYFGLLWQWSKDIQFSDGANLQAVLTTAATTAGAVGNWQRSLESMGAATHSLTESVKAKNRKPDAVAEPYMAYTQSIFDLLDAANRTGHLFLQKDLIDPLYIGTLRQCNFLFFNLRQKNYTAAISNVINVLQFAGDDKKGVTELLKYANFMACIAEADTPEEMQSAIELFALPPGSSRAKKVPGRFACALNAYVGPSGGSEYLGGARSPKPILALTAPVGVSCSWGLGSKKAGSDPGKKLEQGSIGFFIPIIDVGAVTALRFGDKEYENLPELSWGNILAPGLYAVYDVWGKWPVACGAGFQMGPQLRKKGDQLAIYGSGGVRLGAFITIDIPVTYFYLGKGK